MQVKTWIYMNIHNVNSDIITYLSNNVIVPLHHFSKLFVVIQSTTLVKCSMQVAYIF